MRSEEEIQQELSTVDKLLRHWRKQPDYDYSKGVRIPQLLVAKDTLIWVLGATVGTDAIEESRAKKEEAFNDRESSVRDLPTGEGESRVGGTDSGG